MSIRPCWLPCYSPIRRIYVDINSVYWKRQRNEDGRETKEEGRIGDMEKEGKKGGKKMREWGRQKGKKEDRIVEVSITVSYKLNVKTSFQPVGEVQILV